MATFLGWFDDSSLITPGRTQERPRNRPQTALLDRIPLVVICISLLLSLYSAELAGELDRTRESGSLDKPRTTGPFLASCCCKIFVLRTYTSGCAACKQLKVTISGHGPTENEIYVLTKFMRYMYDQSYYFCLNLFTA